MEKGLEQQVSDLSISPESRTGRGRGRGGRGRGRGRGGGGNQPGNRRNNDEFGVFVYHNVNRDFPLQAVLKRLEEEGFSGLITYFRERQHFGFVSCNSPEDADSIVSILNDAELDSQKIYAERTSRITPGRDPRENNRAQQPQFQTQQPSQQQQQQQQQTSASSDIEPSDGLVIKNLPFNITPDDLSQALNNGDDKVTGVKFHVDNSGFFRGIAFLKLRSVEDATKVMEQWQGSDYFGRRIRVEYKKKLAREEINFSLDDPDAKILYDQLCQIRDDPTLDGLSFPATLSSSQRAKVHHFAEKLGLVHHSQQDGDARYIVVYKRFENSQQHDGSSQLGTSPSSHSGGGRLGDRRGGRRDNYNDRGASNYHNPYGHQQHDRDFGSSPPAHSSLSIPPEKNWRTQRAEAAAAAPAPTGPQLIATRQPRVPDGTNGFSQEYRNARSSRTSLCATLFHPASSQASTT